MNTFKRSLAMMLVLCMLFSMAPITAFAEGTADPAGTAVPAADQPAADQPAAVQPAADQPAADQPAADQPVADQPAANQPAADQPAADQPVADQPAADQPAADQPAANQPAADQPAANQPAADQPAADQPVADQPVADQPAANQPAADQPAAVQSAADQPVADQPAADQPVAGEETAKKASTENPYALNTLDLEDEIETVADVDVQYRILHLDCGRKYFTKDWIIALINEMDAAGYNQLQLAFGNDGLRLLLDEMSVTVNGTTYSGESVATGIKAGNKAYNATVDYNPSVNELTEDEMDAIIAHANSKGIAIVPHMNMPGHMDAILDAIEYVGISDAHFTGYTTSARSLNLNNDAAVAFTKALLQKYVDYFAANGCKFFHIGADEYANDAYSGNMGFPSMGSTLYTKFATFVNDCAAIVENKGMTPRAWNDGISYPDYSDSFDTAIQITYWSQGWWGYSPASASTLSAKGHDMINTNGSYYFILTQSDGIDNPSDTALNFDNTAFAGDSTISNPVGSMFCIWCDYPGTATEQQVAAAARITLRKMAAAMKNSTNFSEEVIDGGFNEDGSIKVDCNDETVRDETTTVEVTGCELVSVTVDVVENAPAIEGAAKVKAWDITPYTADGAFTGSATVKLPVPADWASNLVRGFYMENGSAMQVTGTYADGFYTFKMPHFSVGGLMLLNNSTIENTVNIRIPVGGTSQTYTDSTGNYEDSATIEDSSVARINISGKTETGEVSYDVVDTIESGAQYLITIGNGIITSDISTNGYDGTWTNAAGLLMTTNTANRESHLWTITEVTGGYTVKNANGKYLKIAAANDEVTLSSTPVTLSVIDNGETFTFHNNEYALNNFGNRYVFASSYIGTTDSNAAWTLQKYTPATVESTTVSFTGLKIGTTTAVVGTTQYNIEVLDPNDMFTKEKNVELLVDEVKTITDNTGNYEASYTGAGLDTSIATVRVKDTTVEGGKAPVPVTSIVNYSQYYVQLTDGKYLTSTAGSTENADDAALWSVSTYNYNPSQVYIYSGNNYLFYNNNNGSFTPTSNSWTIYDFNAGEISVNGVKLGTIVNLEESAPVDVTDITITGVSKGETKVIVGETRYNITVIGTTDITIKYQTANGTLIKTETVTVADNATTYNPANFTTENGKYYVVDDAYTTLTIDPKNTTTYTVTVTETTENLSAVTPLTLEYWQTNTQVVDGVGSTTCTRSVTALEAYSENGIEVITLVPEDTYTKSNNKETDPQVNYWRSRLLNRSTNEQSAADGDDETLSGTGFTKIRYWNGTWAVYTVDKEWLPIETLADYQFVLYFMNDMNLADEVSVGTSDWGKKGDGTMAGQYLGLDHVSIAFQVVYEDGTTSPATTSAADLDSFTYLVDAWGNRGVGTIALNQIGDYQIWKVTAETGTHTTTYDTWDPNSGTPAYVTGFVWDENEMTVWEDAKNPVSHYTILNPANNPSKEGAYANLTWDEENESILIRIYIKTVKTEDSLKVVYYDEKFGDTLYEYYISVAAGDNFNEDIGKYLVSDDGTPYIDVAQKPGEFTGEYEDESTRIDVTNYGITNAVPKAQRFETNLTQVPEAVGKYKSELYKYTGSEISEDGKTLYLYYNIDTEVLSPNFVVDFGLPLSFHLSKVIGEDQDTLVESVSVVEKTKYGTLSYNATSKTFTYTPNEILQNIDVLSINIKFKTEPEATLTNVGVTPATTVYYGEQFIEPGSGWTSLGTYANVGEQEAEVLGESTYYGYDDAYEDCTGASDGTAMTATAIGSKATFTFTGTGIQVFANASQSTGHVSVMVKNKETGVYANVSMVDTVVNGTVGTETTGGQIGKNLSGLPVVSLVDLTGIPHATYEVTISKIMDENSVFIDGIRVFGTLDESKYTTDTNPYTDDEEDNPDFYEARDMVLTAMNITAGDSADYKTLYNQIYASTAGASAIITNVSAEYGAVNRQDLLDNGPKNELYLFPGDTLTFNVQTDRVIQLGLKAPEGSASFELNGVAKTLSTTVDMFYKVAEKGGSTHTITVKNTGDKILSVTLLKICDDPNVSFPALTEANIRAILADAGYTEEPEAPTYTMVELKGTDVLIDGTVFDYTGKAIEPAITVNVNGVQLVEGKDYSVTYTNNVEPGTATVTVRGIATASETLGYTGEVSIDFTINAPAEPEVPEETTKPAKPGQGNKPNQDNKPGQGNKPGQNNSVKKATLKITFVNLMGKKVSTATIAKTGAANEYGVFSAQEICEQAPARRHAVWFLPAIVPYGTAASIVVPVI